MSQIRRDMSPDRIKYNLSKLGLNYADLDKKFNLPNNTANKSTRYPHQKGEDAIAVTLGLRPYQIWPSRYASQGIRLTPQPSANYTQKIAVGKAQKASAA
jgi:Ner family transcriptional regulator